MTKPTAQKGFTLIETLIAISILVLAVTGAFAAAQNGISSATFSKDQIVAFYLAQEGVEEVRNIRDENGLAGANWLKSLAQQPGDPCYFTGVCMIDAVENTITICGTEAGSCPILRQDPATGFFGYSDSDTWIDSPFRREIKLTLLNNHEIAVTSTVTWSKGLLQRQFKAEENIFDWQ